MLSLPQISGSNVKARELPAQRSDTPTISSPQLLEQGSYVNRQGQIVHRPAHTDTGQAPAGASAKCRDGSFSFSASRRGTCSHHGGVARRL
ncbi:DUF3761 domain-containing protein [Luteibacter jiangsuensis]|uniref:DUF3761 domain-containing protein n=2 Tax=Luteibacter jiangsuensis TaxID=637577 RepID=A0ABX0Q3K2_9GAMM|nr:DUF3761 domain-containing protein [Luteibacter jiangsuensis]